MTDRRALAAPVQETRQPIAVARVEQAASADTPPALALAIGNRAFARLVRDRPPVARRPALARSPTPAEAVGAWSVAQREEWGVLDDSRTLVEQASPGTSVRLLGAAPIDVVAGPDTIAAMRSSVRHRTLEILHAWLKPLRDELAAEHAVPSRLDVQWKIRQRLGQLFETIRRGKPDEERFEYPTAAPERAAVVNSALFMAQLIGEGAAEQALADRDNNPGRAHKDAAAAAGLGSGDEWCGAFAYLELRQGGLSLPPSLTGNQLTGTGPPVAGNLDGFFLYMPALEVKVGDDWKPLESYHAERGSTRHLQVLPAGGTEFDADTRKFEGHAPPRRGQLASLSDLDGKPGDIVLIDNAKGTYADHITLLRTYDAATQTLWTIGGNEGDAHPVHGSGAWDLKSNPAPSRNEPGALKGEKSRVYAVAGFSAVDYESHTYRTAK